MSFEYYYNWWIASKNRLEAQRNRDEKMMKKFKSQTNKLLANALVGGLYARYCMLVQDLDACLDQIAHPQKRISIKKMVDSAVIRLLELGNELKKIDVSEYHCIDGSLVERKLIPYDVEILYPYLKHLRHPDVESLVRRVKNGEVIYEPPVLQPEIDEEENSQGEVLETEGSPTEEKPQEEQDVEEVNESRSVLHVPVVVAESVKDPEELRIEYINLIQTAERGRVDRLYLMEKEMAIKRRRNIAQEPKGAELEEKIARQEKATRQIQTVWKRFQERKEIERNETKRRFLINMYEPSWKSREEFEIFEANLQKRRDYRDERIAEYFKAIQDEDARILRVVAPGLFEDIADEIREWFHQFYIRAKAFDKFPPEEKGGTILVVRAETSTPEQYLEDYENLRKEIKKAGGPAQYKAKLKQEQMKKKAEEKKKKAEEKKKKAEQKRKEAEKKKKKKRKPGDFEFEFEPTACNEIYDEAKLEFCTLWDKRDDFENPLEKYYMDLITEKICYDTQLEVRRNVDEMMRIELDLLNNALLKDKGKKPKKAKKSKKKKGKKGKKDMTATRTLEDLFQELVDEGIIRQYNRRRLDEYKGDFSYANTEIRTKHFDPPATLLDVRQAVVMNCILPLGVETMKRPRSVLIAGPRQSGKHLLANAIFTETQCVLFDLSPEVTVGKYPGAKGLKMLLHLVTKMSKLLQPSIIYFDAAEKIFYKKVPKEEKELDPKRIGKKLVKGIIKTIKPEDRVLVLGITGAPWMGQAGKMKKAFERTIMIPRPDYGSVYLFWREFLLPYHGVDRNLNFTSLATVTRYYPYSVIKSVVKTVLNPRRIIRLRYEPLRQEELYEAFVANEIEPITDKEYKKFEKWYYKTPLGRQRAILNRFDEQIRAAEAAAAEKEKNKKK